MPTYGRIVVRRTKAEHVSQYESIDPTLSKWAVVNGLHWYAEYQDTEVRTFYLSPDKRDRVHVSVDVPHDGQTVVRVGQNRGGLSRLNRSADFPTPVSVLSQTLDKALLIAKDWLAEDHPPH